MEALMPFFAPVCRDLAGEMFDAANGTMSRARLLAHCSAAIRPRPDVKARAYNLVLELEGKEAADTVAALLEDRDGERALIRATRADPEDVTPERLPYIIDQVKLGAGEYAAARAREESRVAADAKQAEHDDEIARVRQTASEEVQKAGAQSAELAQSLAQQTLQRVQAESQLQAERDERAKEQRKKRLADEAKFSESFNNAARLLHRLRWEIFTLYGSALLWTLLFTEATVQALFVVALTLLGFWFFPSVFERPLHSYALWVMRRRLQHLGVADMLSLTEKPDFSDRLWAVERFEALSEGLKAVEAPESQSVDATAKSVASPASQ
ncbi:hypothetical protein LBW60_22940 [Ralstonia solanacearum]|uniref:hypothetical protein n=1 Tax=Ralstonia solanacearum TaxID=305 RepID=UPI002306A61A|nr:hypothetical protein [Ralstonia solanacearum]MDB0511547.1 hypothetical protein [Ralstonia solanacearum]MDB0516177.1 hypothetical protein [Ralstonia solanacearum]